MAWWVEELASKTEDRRLIRRAHIVGGEAQP